MATMTMSSGVTVEMKRTAFNDLSVRSSRRILQLCEESQNNATHTLVALDHQGEQLNSIESHLGCLHDDLRLAEDKLSTAVARYDKSRYKHGLCGLEHIFLRVRRRLLICFNMSPRKASIFRESARGSNNNNSNTTNNNKNNNNHNSAGCLGAQWEKLEAALSGSTNDQGSNNSHQATHSFMRRTSSLNSRFSSGPNIPTDSCHNNFTTLVPGDSTADREIEENFGKISDMVSNLKQMSLDISSELTNQNSQTERLAKKICVNRNQVEKANRKADILLH
ncbi:synaptosomal-associated protein 23-like [Symsagittifera roscoffensis]|uniref:synaptosomal-associated protein 23-like n=1 Tax=Symsagittifera roscoffensis TaxID=84072 RepID=UPI00307B104D